MLVAVIVIIIIIIIIIMMILIKKKLHFEVAKVTYAVIGESPDRISDESMRAASLVLVSFIGSGMLAGNLVWFWSGMRLDARPGEGDQTAGQLD